VIYPSGLEDNISYSTSDGFILHTDCANTLPDLNAEFPSGTYKIRLSTTHDGTKTVTLNLTGDDYPGIPQIRNFTEARTVNPNASFTLEWFPLDGGSTQDFIQLRITDINGYLVFGTPLLDEPGALNGTSTAATIPAHILAQGTSYLVELFVARPVADNESGYPGVRALGGYAVATLFTLRTASPPTITTQPLGQSVIAGSTVTFLVGASGTSLSYQWQKNNADIPSATNATYVISRSNASDAGRYGVVVRNAVGLASSNPADLVVFVPPTFTQEPRDRVVPVGDDLTLDCKLSGTPPLACQWHFADYAIPYMEGGDYMWTIAPHEVEVPGATNSALKIFNVSRQHQGRYWLTVTNLAGEATSKVVQVVVASSLPGSRDSSFRPDPSQPRYGSYSSNVNGYWSSLVTALAVQADGRILVRWANGFAFSRTNLDNSPILRMNRDGTWDQSFKPPTPATVPGSDAASAIFVQPDQKILLLGGVFSTDSSRSNNIARLNSDGSLDDAYRPAIEGGWVDAMLPEPDGAVVIAGEFTRVGGIARPHMARLRADGTLDPSFVPEPVDGDGSWFGSLARQADGKILVARAVASGNQWNSSLARLHPNGVVDTSFMFDANANGFTSLWVSAMAVQHDGKIILGGSFDRFGTTNVAGILRLRDDGSLDTQFVATPPGIYSGVSDLTIQKDDRIVVVGDVRLDVQGRQSRGVLRLNPNGTVDTTFDTGFAVTGRPDNSVPAVCVFCQPDGQLLVGGSFMEFDGVPANGIVRLNGGNYQPWLRILRPSLGKIRVVGEAPSGADLHIESSPDLLSWSRLDPLTVGNGFVAWETTSGSDGAQRFYRAVPGNR
jgi:uncharacterized delta-60 repeat protein